MDALLWLNQLQQTDETQAGLQLVGLHQLFQNGCPGENGFIVPDGCMQTLWQQIDWPREILQDFPELDLNRSRFEAAQVQAIAQTIQKRILEHPLPDPWAQAWQQGLSSWPKQRQLILTPYLWAVPPEQSRDAAQLLSLKPSLCSLDLAPFWTSLKGLWAQLFQAQRLHVLGYLGLRPDQIHLSVLVQPVAKAVKASGWLQLSPNHFDLEAVPQVNLDLWQGDRWPECHRYDRRGAQWVGYFTPPVFAAADAPQRKRRGTSGKTNLLSDATLQALVNLVAVIPPQAYSEAPLTLAWILPSAAAQAKPKLLGFLPDLPLPLHPSLKSIHHQRSAAPRQSVQADGIAPLAIGLGASPGQITAPVVVVKSFDAIAPSTCCGVILVTPHLEPIHLPWLQKAAGLLCEMGGVTSHGAILARELGCPAIVGLTGIMKTLQTGQWVTLDGRLGKIYPANASDGVPWMTAPLDTLAQEPEPSSAVPLNTQLFASFSHLNAVKDAQAQAIDGICLVRGEWLLLAQRAGPQVLTALADVDYDHLGLPMGQTLGAMAQAIAPRPVYYRSIDCTTDWDGRLPSNSGVQNPSLGLRGTLWHHKDPQLFEMELAMLSTLLSQGITNLRLILPYVRSPQEVAFCVEKMRKAGIHPDQLPLWMMAEVPSVLFALEQYQQLGLQGIAIGSSDLAQLLLGIDRDHAAFREILNQNRSVLNDAVAQLVQRASALGLSSILCGDLLLHEQPNPQWLAQLIQAGLTGVAVELDAIAKTRGAIAQAEGSLP